MENINNQIQKGDKILAMFTVRGNVIAQVSCDDFTSVEQVMFTLRSRVEKYSGIAQFFIRNFTSGWHINTPLYIPQVHVQSTIYAQQQPSPPHNQCGIA